MAVLAIVTSSPPGVEGGHLIIARALVAAARACGHEAHLVVTPDHGFGRLTSSYWKTWRTDVSCVGAARIEQVISLRYPSHAVRHAVHVCWLNHLMREYYDLWPRLTAHLSPANHVKEGIRRTLVHAADGWLLRHNVTRVVAQSHTIQRRLMDDLRVPSKVLWPPAPQRAYRCDRYGDYIFTMSRLNPLKRIDLLIRALAEPPAQGVRAIIAGEGEVRSSLEELAASLGVGGRISFLGRVNDETILAHLACCRAVWFTPFAEDYGFVSVEAFASRKPVITCRDSGGPAELVRHEDTGLVCEPTPSVLALALARLSEDAPLAERLGANGAALAATMTWEAAIGKLVRA